MDRGYSSENDLNQGLSPDTRDELETDVREGYGDEGLPKLPPDTKPGTSPEPEAHITSVEETDGTKHEITYITEPEKE